KIARIYTERLTDKIVKPVQIEHAYHTYHIYNIRSTERNALQAYLLMNGVNTEIHYPVAPHKQEGYSTLFDNENFPVSEEIHATTLSLPISYSTTAEDAIYVSDKINEFFG